MRLNALYFYAIAYMVFLYLPILFIPLFSFNDSTIVAFPLQGFTLEWYGMMAGNEAMQGALWNSIKVGVSSAVLATTFGVLGARAIVRYRFFARPAITGVIMTPLFLPEIIVAISLLVVMLQLGLSLSLVTVTLAHTLLAIPYSMAILMSNFEGFDQSLEEAASDLGETPLGAFFRVTLPNVLPGIISSLLITFTISLDEFIVAFFLADTEPTLPVYIFSQIRFPAAIPGVLALGTILLVASFLLLTAGELLRRSSVKRLQLKEDAGI
ncbi:MAG: ABC transporter permease [Pseudomonadota bacterium]